MNRLLIIADDLTGALDTGVQFSKQGIRSKTICCYENMDLLDGEDWQVTVINSESRHICPKEAYQRVYDICRYAKERGYTYFYKKTDSGLRGNLGSELSAVIDATGYQELYFAPSYPEMDRKTIQGIHYWKGKEIHLTAFGKDRLNPVTTSNVADLIHQQTKMATWNHEMVSETEAFTLKEAGIHIMDAESDDNLLEIARQLKGYHPHLMAGCAGFASVLSEIFSLQKEKKQEEISISKLLILSGSIHTVTQKQIQFARANGIDERRISLADKLMEESEFENQKREWMENCVEKLGKEPHVLMIDSLDEIPNETVDYCRKKGIDLEKIPNLIANNLAAVADFIQKNCHDDSWLNENVWEKYGRDDQIGAMNEMTPEMVLKAMTLVKKGKVYDLETTRFKGMPIWDGHCGFDLLSYASYQGRHNMLEDPDIPNAYNWYNKGAMCDPEKDHFGVGFNTELVITPMHLGTHIDAFCHCTIGDKGMFYNGFTSEKYTTSFGPVRCDVSKIPPMVLRGVLLDMAGYKGVDHIENNYIVTAEDIEGCLKWEGVELQPGDAVFVRMGEKWPEGCCGDAGLGVSAARYLVEEGGAIVVGDDMACVDGFNADGSSSWPNHQQPVHHYLLVQQGVHIIEFLQLDELAADKEYEFCFICTPSKIKGATGMFIRPIAIV